MSPRPTAWRATSYDVARESGVAQSTVSRCFQPGSHISPATRARVTSVANRLGYLPNALARSLITRRSNLVGVVATNYTLRGNPDVVYALGESLAAAGKQLLLITVESDAAGIADLRGVLEYPVAGLISCVLLADDAVRDIQWRGVPLVLYNRHSRRIAVDGVTSNHEAAAAEIAVRLVAAGHRNFLCVAGPPDAPVSRLRRDGFAQALACRGIHEVPVIDTDFSYAGGRHGLLQHVAAIGQPSAVFCTNDQLAMGVMDACRFQLGLSVPRDVSVVGFDDVAEGGRPGYELTTMQQPSVQMARIAVDILVRRLAEPDGDAINAVVDAVFVPRQSARLAE